MSSTTSKTSISILSDEFRDRLISDPKETNGNPIEGYQDVPVLTLEKAVEPIIPIILQVVDYVIQAKNSCKKNSMYLTLDESAAIYLYTMPTKFYETLNDALRIKNRHKLKPWFAFLKLFITALKNLPSVNGTFWRGVPCDIVSEYITNSIQIWWSVNSCSTQLNVVEMFLNKKGTLFNIQAMEGKNISEYSAFQLEDEIILMPGVHLRVKSKMDNFENALSIVHLEQQKYESTQNFIGNPQSNSVYMMTGSGLRSADIPSDATWSQIGITVAGGNEKGSSFDQFFSPEGLYTDENGTVYVADMNNNRIMMWRPGAKSGQRVVGGHEQGDRLNQLFWPTDVIVDKKNNSLLICDSANHRIVRWPRQGGTSGVKIVSDVSCSNLTMDAEGNLYISSKYENMVTKWTIGENNGAVVAGGNGQGDSLDQLNQPSYIFVDRQHSVYVSDTGNCRVMKWMQNAEEGIVVAGGQGAGDDLTKLSSPAGVLVDQWDTVFVADSKNDRVMRWRKGENQGSIVVGGNGQGEEANQLCGPSSLSFDLRGNLYVVDAGNHRVQRFDIQ